MSKLPGGFRDRWNRKVQGIGMSYGREPCLSDFSGFLNEETILVNDPIFSREAVQDYATHPEKNLNKHKEIGNFATHSTKKVSMIYPLYDSKRNLDECKSFKQKGLQEKRRFLFDKNCAMAACLQYLPVTTRETIRKGKNAKFVRKGTRLLCMVVKLKNPKKNLKRVVRKQIITKRTFTEQQLT